MAVGRIEPKLSVYGNDYLGTPCVLSLLCNLRLW